jgi:hypothetical protein
MTDYLNGSSSSAVNYSLYGVHDGTTTLVADLVGAKLDYDNLKQILDNDVLAHPWILILSWLTFQLLVAAQPVLP